MALLKNRDIVIVGQQPWDVEIGSNCKNIAEEFSKHNRVLYVNSALDRITYYRNKYDAKVIRRMNVINGKEDGLVPVTNNLWTLFPNRMIESINWIKNQTVFEWLNKINNKRFAQSITQAIQQLGFSNIILFNDNDMFRSYHLKQLLAPAVSIYYSRDYMLAVDYWNQHGTKMEPELIAKSSLCVANSTYLANYCKKYNPLSFYVGQGCELNMFMHIQDPEKPKDIAGIAGPVIGYVGALQSLRLDLKVIEHISLTRPEWSIIMVGPEDPVFKQSNLHRLHNVYFTGPKEPHRLPSYINAFDVCINPQIVNEVTIGNYPRKIDEYLAVGKPVVATRTEAMSIFSGHTYLAGNKEEYVKLIEQALQENSPEKMRSRKEFASTHTWENSVAAIYSAIEVFEKK